MKIIQKKYLITALSMLFGLAAAFMVSALKFESDCEGIYDSVLRLHVIANSDSEEDQELKLKVRDSLLEKGNEVFFGSVTAAQAQEKVEANRIPLIETAERVCCENGKTYTVKIETVLDWFPTKTYENVTLPAGKYAAVRVVIGEGKGHNWWCVMYPPMCLPAAESEVTLNDVLTKEEMGIVLSNPKYEIRFKIAEWYSEIKARWEKRAEQKTGYAPDGE